MTRRQFDEGRGIANIVCVQNHYNLAHRDDDGWIDQLAAEGIAYVPYFPLGGFTPLQSTALSDVAKKLGTTPMHPEYPSQAGINAGAARTVLEAVFGNGTEDFVVLDTSDARLSRKFTNFAQMAQEHKEVRIWGGIHFRNSLEVGDAMGRKVAEHLVANYMKPAR